MTKGLSKDNTTLGLPGGAMVKNMLASAGDTRDADLISQLGTAQEEEMATHSSILA